MGSDDGDRQLLLQGRLAQPQEDDRGLVLGLQVDQHHPTGVLQVAIAHRLGLAPPGHLRGQEGGLLGRGDPRPEVDVIGAQHHPGELRPGQVGLHGEPATGEYPHPASGGLQPRHRGVDRIGPGGGLQDPLAAHQGARDPVVLVTVAETEPALVAVPLLIDLRQVTGQPALHPVLAMVGAQFTAGGAVLAGGPGGDQVEGPGVEPVVLAGQRPDRADLDDIA